jgi:alpha-galactosidase
MTNIAIIGAGGWVFPLRLIGDLLSFPELQNSQIRLMDIDATRLERTYQAARELVAHHGLPAQISQTLCRREALAGADFVIITFQVGGLEAYQIDKEIPARYGIDQTVGDTLGPGGVMRFLRSAPEYLKIAQDMLELCPKALLINYANPMAMATWYLSSLGVQTVGLCHSVQNTIRMLARALDIPFEEVYFRSAGINHQAWLLEYTRRQPDGTLEDLYPRLRQQMVRDHLEGRLSGWSLADSGDHTLEAEGFTDYEGGQETVRTSLMHAFGYFHTESSHHASEYLPYFRKTPHAIQHFIAQRWDYFEICKQHEDADHDRLLNLLKSELTPSLEYGAQIIHAIKTGQPCLVYGNVPNKALIENLPYDCCVEVPCWVDAGGVHPTPIGKLPPQLAALNRTNINVQELAVEAAKTGKLEHVYHAIMLDPLTASQLNLEQIRTLVDELLAAQAPWLPQFVLESGLQPA